MKTLLFTGFVFISSFAHSQQFRYPDSVFVRVSGDTVFTEYYHALKEYYTLPAIYADYKLFRVDTSIASLSNGAVYVTPTPGNRIYPLVGAHINEYSGPPVSIGYPMIRHDTAIINKIIGSYYGKDAGLYLLTGHDNMLWGINAGKYLTTESYCVIVGSDSAAINAKGHDMIWIVDWCHPLLCQHPAISELLYGYQKNYIETKKDCIQSRKRLVQDAIKIMNP